MLNQRRMQGPAYRVLAFASGDDIDLVSPPGQLDGCHRGV